MKDNIYQNFSHKTLLMTSPFKFSSDLCQILMLLLVNYFCINLFWCPQCTSLALT